MRAPLHGITVLDLSRLLPGPYATQVLGDLGGDVIKVEDPRGGDYLRWMPPMAGAHSAMFLALNRGKRSVALDLKVPADVEAFKVLVARAHVVVESFRPGVMDKLGVGFHALRAVNPSIILCSISGYGQDGPDAPRAGHDLNYVARAGLLAYGTPGSQPAIQVADIGGGSLWAVVQILAALRRQEQTGEGAWLDVSMTDGAWSFLTMSLACATAGGQPLTPAGDTLNGGIPCYRVYLSSDGVPVSVGALEPKFWEAFCSAIGRGDLVDKGLDHGEAGARVVAELETMFRGRTAEQWRAFFDAQDCCVEVAQPTATAHRTDRTLSRRGLTVRVEQPGSGTVELPVTPLKISGYQPDYARPAPALDGDRVQVLAGDKGGTS
ncbi:MAG: CoA transferase [Deltaproteobacteria bacterium]|nr:CoA transferase [Deltaproteobacteria bacterium]